MSLFNFGKKKDKEKTIINGSKKAGNVISVKVLGAGCKSCHQLYENVKKAADSMDIPVETEYITDMKKIVSYGVTSMPAIVINEKVVSAGKVLKPAEAAKLLQKEVN